MVLGKIIGIAGLVGAIALLGVFIRDAAAVGVGPAIGSVGANIGVAGTGFATLGTGIGTGISGVIKPFTNLLSFFGTLGSIFGTAPAASGAVNASQPAVQTAQRVRTDRSNLSNLLTGSLPSFASAVDSASALGQAILSSQQKFPGAFLKAQGL